MAIFFRDPEWDPFRELAQLKRRMEGLVQGATGVGRHPWRTGVYPLINISEDRDHVYVRAEMPGVNPQDLEITVKDNNLVLRGERKIPTADKNVNYHRRERESGYFRRLVRLPVPINADKVEASCKDGILTIVLAKPEEIKPRQITVKTV